MLYGIVGAGVVMAGGGWVLHSRGERRKWVAREEARAERQRARIRDWAIMQWLYGSRANLRITHQPESGDGEA